MVYDHLSGVVLYIGGADNKTGTETETGTGTGWERNRSWTVRPRPSSRLLSLPGVTLPFFISFSSHCSAVRPCDNAGDVTGGEERLGLPLPPLPPLSLFLSFLFCNNCLTSEGPGW